MRRTDWELFDITPDTSVTGITNFIKRARERGAAPMDGSAITTKDFVAALSGEYGVAVSSQIANAALRAAGCYPFGGVMLGGKLENFWGVRDGVNGADKGILVAEYRMGRYRADGGDGLAEVVRRGIESGELVCGFDLVSVVEVAAWAGEQTGEPVSPIMASKALVAAGARRIGQLDTGNGGKVVCFMVRGWEKFEGRPVSWLQQVYYDDRGIDRRVANAHVMYEVTGRRR